MLSDKSHIMPMPDSNRKAMWARLKKDKAYKKHLTQERKSMGNIIKKGIKDVESKSRADEGYHVQARDEKGSVNWQERYPTKEKATKIRKQLESGDPESIVSVVDDDTKGVSYPSSDRR